MSSTANNAKECKMSPVSNIFSDFQEGYESYPPMSQRRHFSDNLCLESKETEGFAINTQECETDPVQKKSPAREKRHFSDNMCLESKDTEGFAINNQECKSDPVKEKSPARDKRHFLGNSTSSVFEDLTPTRDDRIEKEHSDREGIEKYERRQFSKCEVTEEFATHVQECKISSATAISPPGDKRHFTGKSASSVFEEETPTRDARIEKEHSDRMDFEKAQN